MILYSFLVLHSGFQLTTAKILIRMSVGGALQPFNLRRLWLSVVLSHEATVATKPHL